MNKILLITRPWYDDGTKYLYDYSSLVIKRAEAKNILFKDFKEKEANKENVEKFINKQNPKILFINGHGEEEILYGQNNQPIFSLENIKLLKDRFVYARACSAGIIFGKKMIEGNSGCFIGYKYPFSFLIDEKWSTKPMNDNIAKLYLEPSNEIIISLLEGKNSFESNKKSKSMMIGNMKRILKLEEKKEQGASAMLQVLWNNFEGQVLYGNKEYTLN